MERTNLVCFWIKRRNIISILGKRSSPYLGAEFLKPLVLLFWILGTIGFPLMTTFHWMFTHLCSNPDYSCLTLVIRWEVVKKCH